MDIERVLTLPNAWVVVDGADQEADATGIERATIQAWLAEFDEKRNTQRAYSREARRFWLWWTTSHPGRSLREMTRGDLDAYVSVLEKPPAAWIKSGDPGWRPLKGPLSQASRRQALIILQVLFEYLVQAEVLSSNVVRLKRDKGPVPHRARRLVPGESTMAKISAWMLSDAGTCIAPRDAFLWQWIYWTGARRHEMEHATLARLRSTFHAGRVLWWWDVIGKGEKAASIPLTEPAVAALVARLKIPLADLAATLRQTPARPLAAAERGATHGIGPSGVYLCVRRVAAAVQDNATAIGLTEDDADAIAAVRPHTLRAFRATHLFEAGVDPRHVQRFMRHADFNTTLIYDHTSEAQFHDGVLNRSLGASRSPLGQERGGAGR